MPKEETGKVDWLRLLEEYEQTELTQAAFVEQKGVKLATFRYWLYKERNKKAEPSATFVEVALPSVPFSVETASVVLDFAQDLRLRFSSLPSPSYLASLLQALAGGKPC
jgi:hypothetical protein